MNLAKDLRNGLHETGVDATHNESALTFLFLKPGPEIEKELPLLCEMGPSPCDSGAQC